MAHRMERGLSTSSLLESGIPLAEETSDTPVFREGWLYKSDPRGKNWKKRYCVLTSHRFMYYSDSSKQELRGEFVLENTRFHVGWNLNNKKSPTPHVFSITTGQRNYYFSCRTHGEALDWRQAYDDARSFREDAAEIYTDNDDANASNVEEIERQYSIDDDSVETGSDTDDEENDEMEETRNIDNLSTLQRELERSPSKSFRSQQGRMPPIHEDQGTSHDSSDSISPHPQDPTGDYRRGSKQTDRVSINVLCTGLREGVTKKVSLKLPRPKLKVAKVKELRKALLKKLGRNNIRYATLFVQDDSTNSGWRVLQDTHTAKEAGIDPETSVLRLVCETTDSTSASVGSAGTRSPPTTPNFTAQGTSYSPPNMPTGEISGYHTGAARPHISSMDSLYSPARSVQSFTSSPIEDGEQTASAEKCNGTSTAMEEDGASQEDTASILARLRRIFDKLSDSREGGQVTRSSFVSALRFDDFLGEWPGLRKLVQAVENDASDSTPLTWRRIQQIIEGIQGVPVGESSKADANSPESVSPVEHTHKPPSLTPQALKFALEPPPPMYTELGKLATKWEEPTHGDDEKPISILLKIHVGHDSEGHVYVRPGDNAEQLAEKFIQEYKLDYNAFFKPLVSELNLGLLEAYRLENQAVKSARAGAARRLEVAQQCIATLIDDKSNGSIQLDTNTREKNYSSC
eukprot:gb/GECG01011238.1/.p1 GENE.gb/GECG01011238.1/~~gb/GECG01011238.1/.p1  ORF type:complete len:688 (+),score=95.35 gb/GECG01011238.1/:1-2064(+)